MFPRRIRIELPGLLAVAGKTLAESGIHRPFGVIIVAIRKADGLLTCCPGSRMEIASSAVLLLSGPEEGQRRLAADCR